MTAVPTPYSIVPIPGLRNSERRSIVLLTSQDGRLDAQAEFERIESERKRRSQELRARFDYWIEGKPKPNWFHGWNLEEYKHCLCFKLNMKNVMHRFYGFVCHPQRTVRPRFELCVLCFFDAKASDETDKHYLREAERLLADNVVGIAIGEHFPDTKKSKSCLH